MCSATARLAESRWTVIPRRRSAVLEYKLETELHEEGYATVCGVDEAGRGPLCGPVVAAACILPDGLV
ncbi:MAG: hypothetical protein IJF33_01690, partial [Clostridia bacterium]|nr:hypothetical protein [Clostridia bacterium]